MLRSDSDFYRSPFPEAFNESGQLLLVGSGQGETQFEAAPYRAVQKFSVVRCRYNDDIARQVVDLHEEGRDNPLDLAGLVGIATFLSDRIEFVKKQHTRRSPRVVEHTLEPASRLAKEAADHHFIAHDEERLGKTFGDRLC